MYVGTEEKSPNRRDYRIEGEMKRKILIGKGWGEADNTGEGGRYKFENTLRKHFIFI